MKVLFAIVLVAACSIAEARAKPTTTVRVAQAQDTQSESTEPASKPPARAEVSQPRSVAPKNHGDTASRDAYNVPLLRDARSMR